MLGETVNSIWSMPTLIIGEKVLEMPGLGRNKPLSELSQKRITKAVRQALRAKYGLEAIACSCRAEIESGTWAGRCWIEGQEHVFKIEE
jgi:hypothetical protein